MQIKGPLASLSQETCLHVPIVFLGPKNSYRSAKLFPRLKIVPLAFPRKVILRFPNDQTAYSAKISIIITSFRQHNYMFKDVLHCVSSVLWNTVCKRMCFINEVSVKNVYFISLSYCALWHPLKAWQISQTPSQKLCCLTECKTSSTTDVRRNALGHLY